MNSQKNHNDQLSMKDFDLMGSALGHAYAHCQKALRYGPDMKSSRLLLMREASEVLFRTLKKLDDIEEARSFNEDFDKGREKAGFGFLDTLEKHHPGGDLSDYNDDSL